MEKLIKTAKGLDKFFNILSKVLVVALIVAVVLAAFATYFIAIGQEGVSLHLTNVAKLGLDVRSTLWILWLSVVCAIGAGVLYYLCFGKVRQALAPMKEGKPFAPETPKLVSTVAWYVLGIGALGSFIEELPGLFAPGSVQASFDVTFILIFFVLLLMSYVFEYGAELQRQADETL